MKEITEKRCTANINIRLSEQLLDDVDATWQDRGFNARSEFIRQAIRDSVHETQHSPEALEALLESSQQAQREESVSSEDVCGEFLNE